MSQELLLHGEHTITIRSVQRAVPTDGTDVPGKVIDTKRNREISKASPD
jgi:hypothetical protein